MWSPAIQEIRISDESSQTAVAQPFHQWCFPDGAVWAIFFRINTGFLVRFPEFADFTISADGTDIVSYPASGTSAATLEHLYSSQVLLLAYGLQGKLVFHASGVDTSEGALAFMGISGRGKSTLAASFSQSGSRFLTDDGLFLQGVDGGYWVQPSHPSIRLWDDSRQALVHKAATLGPAVQFTPKTRVMSDDALVFCDQSRPLHCVYFLGDEITSEITIERIKPSEAFIGLVNNSFLLDIESRDVIAKHFEELMQMVSLPMYYRLDYPRCYEDLPRVREAILRHAAEVQSLPA